MHLRRKVEEVAEEVRLQPQAGEALAVDAALLRFQR